MRSGRLRHRIDIEEPADTRNTAGELTPGWATWAPNVPAAFEKPTAMEFLAAQQLRAAASQNIRIRYRQGVLPTMRVRHGTTIYEIKGITPDEKTGRHELVLNVTTGVNAG